MIVWQACSQASRMSTGSPSGRSSSPIGGVGSSFVVIVIASRPPSLLPARPAARGDLDGPPISSDATPVPLTPSGSKVLASMRDQYGAEKGERVFYATANKKPA